MAFPPYDGGFDDTRKLNIAIYEAQFRDPICFYIHKMNFDTLKGWISYLELLTIHDVGVTVAFGYVV